MTEFKMYDRVLRKIGYEKLKENKHSDSFPVYYKSGSNISMHLDADDNIVEWVVDYSKTTKQDFYNDNLSLFRQLKLMMLINE